MLIENQYVLNKKSFRQKKIGTHWSEVYMETMLTWF